VPTDALIPTPQQILAWIEEVFSHGVRRPGYPADRWAEQWIRERFAAFGLEDVRAEPVTLPRWEDRHTAFRVWPSGHPAEALDLPCFALPHCQPTRGVEADVVPLPADARGVEGRIAVSEVALIRMPQTLMQRRATRCVDPDGEFEKLTQVLPFSPRFQAVLEPAMAAKAAAFVGVLSGVPWETQDYYVPYDGTARPIPGVWVSAANGRKLAQLMARGPVRGRIELDAVREDVTCYNVIGTLPGASEEWVIVGSHHDGPWSSAVEDASGIALVLAQARYWSRVPRDERPHNLMFLLNAGHMVAGAGCRAFIEAHRDLLPKVVVEIHLEHAARECRCEHGRLVPTDAPEVRWWFTSLNTALEDVVEDALRAEDLRRSLVISPEFFAPHPTTDGGFFHLEKVPLVQYLTAPMYLFDSQDTLDKIHEPSLVPVTRATIRIIEDLAAHTAAGLRAGVRPWDGPPLLG
jgi:hypothetical protein